jgi:hypothetical protein
MDRRITSGVRAGAAYRAEKLRALTQLLEQVSVVVDDIFWSNDLNAPRLVTKLVEYTRTELTRSEKEVVDYLEAPDSLNVSDDLDE